ncbi:hypothetical protein H6P81_004247 [Aristolochia fimbriata]|uniref:Uncharacterized protein n=1 Tax=Aristolochia fimbriata TaxID=158543 RepID=A0AAV7FGJ9_ARIFI|nr:hypothetical protein H6P81_004247 [Aristolochia fimbriata]
MNLHLYKRCSSSFHHNSATDAADGAFDDLGSELSSRGISDMVATSNCEPPLDHTWFCKKDDSKVRRP